MATNQGTTDRTKDGRQKVYATPKPHDTSTYFTGAGDDTTIGDGARLLFNLGPSDTSSSVDITFSKDVWIKDGFMIVDNAPFGAYININVVHPTAGIVGTFGRSVPVFGSGWFPMNTEDCAQILQGLILRITVYNSDDSDGIQDPPADFRVAGRLELYRDDT
jgi:hypothetical protein